MKKLINILFKQRFAFLIAFLFLNSTFNILLAEESLLEFNLGESESLYSINSKDNIFINNEASLNSVNIRGVKLNQKILTDSSQIFRWTAIEYAQNRDAKNASLYIEKYIKSTLHVGFINNDIFGAIAKSNEFKELEEKYKLRFSFMSLFYLFSSLIGIFIVIILNIKREKNNISVLLISSFVLMHSIFIFHIFIFKTNLQFRYPHTLFMSIIFSFLYGPLLYFYFKVITQQHKFRKIDLIHFIPTIIILVVVLPLYFLSEDEKLKIMLGVGVFNKKLFILYIFIAKLFSLMLYGYLILKIYYNSIKRNANLSLMNFKWQKSIVWLSIAYIMSYAIYGLIITKIIPRFEFLYHLQVLFMALMVLYIGIMSYLKPNLFKSDLFEKHLYKYKKSGLTIGFSEDLKNKLVYLLEDEKIYRQNNISLEILSQRLDTTRHNTSQVINEHFGLNFFELINKYRINEALEILQSDTHKNMNIIDVAYEVGFNNKVTFNKSFKKMISLTPTQYIASISA